MGWTVTYSGQFSTNTDIGSNVRTLVLTLSGRSEGCPTDNSVLMVDSSTPSNLRLNTVNCDNQANLRITRGGSFSNICSVSLYANSMSTNRVVEFTGNDNCGILGITDYATVQLYADTTVRIRGNREVTLTIAVKDKYSATSPSAGNANFGDTSLVTLVNSNTSHLNDLSHQVTWYLGDGTTYSHTETVGAGNTDAQYVIPAAWAAFVPSATVTTCTVKISTYKGSYKVGSDRTTTIQIYVPNTIIPSIGSLTAWVNNPETGLEWVYFHRITGVKVRVNDPVPSIGSAIASYEFSSTFDDLASFDSSTLIFSVAQLLGYGNVTISVRAVDQRGRKSDPATITIYVEEYGSPNIQVVTAFRCIASGTASENGTYGNGKVIVSPTSIATTIDGVTTYSSTAKYDIGEVVRYNGLPYICTTPISTPEAWNSTHWQLCQAAYDSTATYAVNDRCIYGTRVYRCRIAIETAENWNAEHWTEELNYLAISSAYHEEGSTTMITAVASMRSGVAYTFGGGNLLASSTYYFKVTVVDVFSSTSELDVLIETAAYAIHVKNGGQGVAFGKTSEQNVAVEINPSWGLYYKGALVVPVVYSEVSEPTLYNAQGVQISKPTGLVWLKRRM